MINKGHYYAQALWSEFEDTDDMQPQLDSESRLVSMAVRLGARDVGTWSPAEAALADCAEAVSSKEAGAVRQEILCGRDPLGEALCRLRPPETRRRTGATYTPYPVVDAMISWAVAMKLDPLRIVEPGAGTARFLVAAGRRFSKAQLIGIETDPVSALLGRANLAVHGLSERAEVTVSDFRSVSVPDATGRTLYVGNPPYVRHHELDSESKAWLSRQAKALGLRASQLAGLHVHFFLATALKAREGDFGAFITSAEWLDVNYGKLVRDLFLHHLGGQGITLIEPTSRTFSDAATTAAITQFVVGSSPDKIRMSRSTDAGCTESLVTGKWLNRARFTAADRWSVLTRKPKVVGEGYIELGEICDVHRGQVTGANKVWIAGRHSSFLPESVLFRCVTRAKELFLAGNVLADPTGLRDVIDIPADLSTLPKKDRYAVERFLVWARSLGANDAYVARNRRAWWSVGLRTPAPILATYMARRRPAFVRNLANARHINIAHGIYPREAMSTAVLDLLARSLSDAVSIADGRTYAGGLTKFEPKEMERILIPNPLEILAEQVA